MRFGFSAGLHPAQRYQRWRGAVVVRRRDGTGRDSAASGPTDRPVDPLIERIMQLKINLIPAAKGISPLRAQYGQPLLIVFGLVALVLLVACTTVATLFEARRSVRECELAVRVSLGASRWRLMRQLLSEGMLIAAAAPISGLILAHWTSPLLVSLLAPSGTPVQLSLGIDSHVLAFTAILSVLRALLFGLIPAWHTSTVNPDVFAKKWRGTSKHRAVTGPVGSWSRFKSPCRWFSSWELRCPYEH